MKLFASKIIDWKSKNNIHTLKVYLYFELQVLNTNSQTNSGKLNIIKIRTKGELTED